MDEKTRLELDELHARIVKMGAETAKLNAEVVKLGTENKWYPLMGGAALVGAVITATITLTKLFL